MHSLECNFSRGFWINWQFNSTHLKFINILIKHSDSFKINKSSSSENNFDDKKGHFLRIRSFRQGFPQFSIKIKSWNPSNYFGTWMDLRGLNLLRWKWQKKLIKLNETLIENQHRNKDSDSWLLTKDKSHGFYFLLRLLNLRSFNVFCVWFFN